MEYSKSDHVLIAAKALINAVPIVGSPVASLINDCVPLSSQRSIATTLEILADRLGNLEDRVDLKSLNKDEFADLYKSCFVVAARTSDATKQRAAANLLMNILLAPGDALKISYTELDHFARCLETLLSDALAALGAATAIVRIQNISPNAQGNYRLNFDQARQKLNEMAPTLLMGLTGELHTYSLLRIASQPPIATENFGNYPLELTSLGWRFVTHVIEA